MPLWQLVQARPAWPTWAEACWPLWHDSQSPTSGSFPPWCGLALPLTIDLLTAWHEVHGAESAPPCGVVPWLNATE